MNSKVDQHTNTKPFTPPSFDFLLEEKAFKIKISIWQKVKNRINKFLSTFFTLKKTLIEYDIQNLSNENMIDEFEPFLVDDLIKNPQIPFKLNYTIKKRITDRLIEKGFSKSNAESIIKKDFKTIQSYNYLQDAMDDMPTKRIYDKGFRSEIAVYKELNQKLKYLVSLGYDKKNSENVLLDAFTKALKKEYLNEYINSIPKYEDYQKGYISKKDIEDTTKKAKNHLFNIGYSDAKVESIITEKYNNSESKEIFLAQIDSIHLADRNV